MEIGIDSFAARTIDPDGTPNRSASERVNDLIEEIVRADRAGLDVFGVGEHHRAEFLDASPTTILAAAAARTENIRLTSAVTVLSADDPVRVFQRFATLDLISRGRAEIVAGRGSFTEAFPLFGLALSDYDELFEEKLELLLEIRENPEVHWSGKHRPPLTGQGVFPRPLQARLPIWLGTGGTPGSFVRAGTLGLPVMVAVIGGDFRRFRPLLDLYREAGETAGFSSEQLRVGVHAFGYVGQTAQEARDIFYPGWEHMMSAIGRERGYRPPSRAQFEAACGPGGPYLVGDARSVAERIVYVDEVLGGVERINIQMTNVMVSHEHMLGGIDALGAEVVPLVNSLADSAKS